MQTSVSISYILNLNHIYLDYGFSILVNVHHGRSCWLVSSTVPVCTVTTDVHVVLIPKKKPNLISVGQDVMLLPDFKCLLCVCFLRRQDGAYSPDLILTLCLWHLNFFTKTDLCLQKKGFHFWCKTHQLCGSSKPHLQATVVTGETWRKAFKSEGLGEIDEITYVDERNGVRVMGLKVAACIKFTQREAVVGAFHLETMKLV